LKRDKAGLAAALQDSEAYAARHVTDTRAVVAAHEAYEETLEDCITELTQKLEVLLDLPLYCAGVTPWPTPGVTRWAARGCCWS